MVFLEKQGKGSRDPEPFYPRIFPDFHLPSAKVLFPWMFPFPPGPAGWEFFLRIRSGIDFSQLSHSAFRPLSEADRGWPNEHLRSLPVGNSSLRLFHGIPRNFLEFFLLGASPSPPLFPFSQCRDVRTREVGIQEIHHKVRPYQVRNSLVFNSLEFFPRKFTDPCSIKRPRWVWGVRTSIKYPPFPLFFFVPVKIQIWEFR